MKGRAPRITLTGCGKSSALHELEVLLSAHGAKAALLPSDPAALPNGIEDLRNDPRRFNAYEAEKRMDAIARTPTALRPETFAERRMKEAAAMAKRASKLNPKKEVAEERNVDLGKLRTRLTKHWQLLEKSRATYEGLAQERTDRGGVIRGIGQLRHTKRDAESRSQ
jgi:hypothetical protein